MSTNTVDPVDGDNKVPTTANEQYYQAYYMATGNNIKDSGWTGQGTDMQTTISQLMEKSPTGTVNPFFLMQLLNCYTDTYSDQLMAGQTRQLQYAQTLSDDWSKIDTCLQSVAQLGAQGKTDPAAYNDAAKALSSAYAQLNVDLYGEGWSGNTEGLTTAYEGGMLADSKNYFPLEPDGSQNSCLGDFNDMINQNNANLNAFYSPDAGNLGGTIDSYLMGNSSAQPVNNLTLILSGLAQTHQTYVSGNEVTGVTPPDGLGELMEGGISTTVGDLDSGDVATSSGIEPFTQTYLSDQMQRYSQYINQMTTMINKLYDTEKQVEQSAEKEYGTYAQNTKSA